MERGEKWQCNPSAKGEDPKGDLGTGLKMERKREDAGNCRRFSSEYWYLFPIHIWVGTGVS